MREVSGIDLNTQGYISSEEPQVGNLGQRSVRQIEERPFNCHTVKDFCIEMGFMLGGGVVLLGLFVLGAYCLRGNLRLILILF